MSIFIIKNATNEYLFSLLPSITLHLFATNFFMKSYSQSSYIFLGEIETMDLSYKSKYHFIFQKSSAILHHASVYIASNASIFCIQFTFTFRADLIVTAEIKFSCTYQVQFKKANLSSVKYASFKFFHIQHKKTGETRCNFRRKRMQLSLKS
jgi:hypothetical protein